MKSKREGGRSDEEGLVLESKSNEGEEVEEGVSVGEVGERGYEKKRSRRGQRWSSKAKGTMEPRQTIVEGERLDCKRRKEGRRGEVSSSSHLFPELPRPPSSASSWRLIYLPEMA